MSWVNFYKTRVNSSYQDYAEKRYEAFIKSIPDAEFLIEAGCGIGTITKALKKGIGIDLFQHELATVNKITAYFGDILNIQDYPQVNKNQCVIHSHGVLEHFDHEDLVKIIELQKSISSLGVHYIPSDKYKNGSFGDERLLPVNYWQQFGRVETFNNGFDLILFVGRV
jgi:hypothetical protein